jgi:hypothetical protein
MDFKGLDSDGFHLRHAAGTLKLGAATLEHHPWCDDCRLWLHGHICDHIGKGIIAQNVTLTHDHDLCTARLLIQDKAATAGDAQSVKRAVMIDADFVRCSKQLAANIVGRLARLFCGQVGLHGEFVFRFILRLNHGHGHFVWKLASGLFQFDC